MKKFCHFMGTIHRIDHPLVQHRHSAPAPVLHLQQLRFAWARHAAPCLDIADLRVYAGEALFLHGPSGCGKSTLLSLMAGVVLAQSGRVALLGRDWRDLRGAARDGWRADHVGYIFQQFNLLPYLSALDNVLLPLRFSKQRRAAARRGGTSEQAAARHWLLGMGLAEDVCQRPAQHLSVGQQQRVAAARALIGQPDVVIADEPTSALDEARRTQFLDLLLAACAAAGSALVFVSHDARSAARFARHVALPDINRAQAAAESAA